MLRFVFGVLVAIAAIINAGPVRSQTSGNPIFIDKRTGSFESAGRQAAASSALAEKAEARGQVRVIIGLNVQLADEDSALRFIVGLTDLGARFQREPVLPQW